MREASQRKALKGLDNVAADGMAAFETLERVIEELQRPVQVQNGVQIPRRSLIKPRGIVKQTTKFTAKRNLVHAQVTVECLLSAMRMPREGGIASEIYFLDQKWI